MKRIVAATMFVLALSAPAARAQTSGARQAADAFGLLGTWARVDCGRPASGANDYDVWTLDADGTLVETNDGGADYTSRYRFEQARMIGDDKIAIEGVYVGTGDRQRIVLAKQGDQQRTFESQDLTTGKMLIVNGAFASNGAQTAWYAKCK